MTKRSTILEPFRAEPAPGDPSEADRLTRSLQHRSSKHGTEGRQIALAFSGADTDLLSDWPDTRRDQWFTKPVPACHVWQVRGSAVIAFKDPPDGFESRSWDLARTLAFDDHNSRCDGFDNWAHTSGRVAWGPVNYESSCGPPRPVESPECHAGRCAWMRTDRITFFRPPHSAAAILATTVGALVLPIPVVKSLRSWFDVYSVRVSVRSDDSVDDPAMSRSYCTGVGGPPPPPIVPTSCASTMFSLDSVVLSWGNAPTLFGVWQLLHDGRDKVLETFEPPFADSTVTFTETSPTVRDPVAGSGSDWWFLGLRPVSKVCIESNPLPGFPGNPFDPKHDLYYVQAFGTSMCCVQFAQVDFLASDGRTVLASYVG